jgi:hypothetical protein
MGACTRGDSGGARGRRQSILDGLRSADTGMSDDGVTPYVLASVKCAHFVSQTRLLLSWVPTRPTHPWSMPYIVSSSIVLRSAIAPSHTFRLFADSSAFSRSSLARAEGSIISITRYCQR